MENKPFQSNLTQPLHAMNTLAIFPHNWGVASHLQHDEDFLRPNYEQYVVNSLKQLRF